MTRRTPTPHEYLPDRTIPAPTRMVPGRGLVRDLPLCRCGLPKKHARHKEHDPEAAALDARRLGERKE